MNYTLKLTQIGNSVGIIIPKDAVSAMGLAKGDEVILTRAPGGFRISAYDYHFAKEMEDIVNINKNRRNALRALSFSEQNV